MPSVTVVGVTVVSVSAAVVRTVRMGSARIDVLIGLFVIMVVVAGLVYGYR